MLLKKGSKDLQLVEFWKKNMWDPIVPIHIYYSLEQPSDVFVHLPNYVGSLRLVNGGMWAQVLRQRGYLSL